MSALFLGLRTVSPDRTTEIVSGLFLGLRTSLPRTDRTKYE